MKVQYNGKCLQWENIWGDLHMIKSGNSRSRKNDYGRWYPSQHSPTCLFEFLEGFGFGSMNGPKYNNKGFNSSNLSVLLLNKAFAKYLTEHEPEIALNIGIAELVGTYREGEPL